MKRVGFLMKIKPEVMQEYTHHQANVWPEMLDALRKHGWRNYSIFAKDDGTLFGYVEVDDSFEKALEGNGWGGGQRSVAGVHGAVFRDTRGCAAGSDDDRVDASVLYRLIGSIGSLK